MIATILKTLTAHASHYALAYVAAAGYALIASLGAFIDIFTALTRDQVAALAWWQIVALGAKCIVPSLTAILAFLNQSLSKLPVQAASPTVTAAPFIP